MILKKTLNLIAITLISTLISAQEETCNKTGQVTLLNNVSKCLKKNEILIDKTQNVTVQVSERSNRFSRNRKAILEDLKINKKENYEKSLNLRNSIIIEKIPLLKGCESKLVFEQGKCFKGKLVNYINGSLSSRTKKIGNEISTNFVINQDNKINSLNISLYYDSENVKNQISRTIVKLPSFISGNNGNVKIKYESISGKSRKLVVEDTDATKEIVKTKNKKILNLKDASIIERIPLFKSCQTVTIFEQKKCFKSKFVEYLNENSVLPSRMRKVQDDNISVKFVINEKKEFSDLNVKLNEGNDVFNKQIYKNINKFPKFIKGNEENKIININYEVPVF